MDLYKLFILITIILSLNFKNIDEKIIIKLVKIRNYSTFPNDINYILESNIFILNYINEFFFFNIFENKEDVIYYYYLLNNDNILLTAIISYLKHKATVISNHQKNDSSNALLSAINESKTNTELLNIVNIFILNNINNISKIFIYFYILTYDRFKNILEAKLNKKYDDDNFLNYGIKFLEYLGSEVENKIYKRLYNLIFFKKLNFEPKKDFETIEPSTIFKHNKDNYDDILNKRNREQNYSKKLITEILAYYNILDLNSVVSDINIITELGKGGFSTVSLVRLNDNYYAEKCTNLSSINNYAINEIVILNNLKKQPDCLKYVVNIYGYYFSNNKLCYLTDLGYSTLDDYKRSNNISEIVKLQITRQISEGIKCIHYYKDETVSNGYLHRDLKLNNIIVYSFSDNKIDVRISDFGLAIINNDEYKNKVGTTGYTNEKILKTYYNYEIDLYSFGIIILNLYIDTFHDDLTKNFLYLRYNDELSKMITEDNKKNIILVYNLVYHEGKINFDNINKVLEFLNN